MGENADPVGLYGKFELTFQLGTLYNNPCDPDQADVRVVFTKPSGGVDEVIAFWDGAAFPVQATRDWKARYAPRETGVHSYRIVVVDRNGRSESEPSNFTAILSSRKGFVQLDPYGPNTFRYSNGEPYHPVGHNLCWPDYFGMELYRRWLGKFQEYGLNWSRIWMNTYSGQGLEWNATDASGLYHGIGRYSRTVSRHFDALLDLAEEKGVHLQMCIFSFNELSTRGYSNWDMNPYNAANGGPLVYPKDFFTNAEVRASMRKLLRYIVARWGYSTSVMCWQLFNEFNMITLTDFTTPGEWHSEMGAHIKSLDPFRHPVTTSLTNQLTGGLWNAAFWQRPEMDFICEHRYSENYPTSQVRLADSGTQLGKPCLVGEVGTNPSGWYDTGGVALKRMAWATALRLSGSMYWWWQSIDGANLYGQYRPLVRFLEGEDFGAYGLSLSDFEAVNAPTGTKIYGIQSPYRAYMVVMGPEESATINGLRVRVSQIQYGTYDVEFWSATALGGRMEVQSAFSDGHVMEFPVPQFSHDLGIKILPRTPEPTMTPRQTPVLGTPTPTPTYFYVPGSLVSQGKPSFASSIFGSGYEAYKANDGITNNTNSRWVSGSQGPHWWYVDLGDAYCLSKVDLYGEQSAGQSSVFNVSGYRIRGSLSGLGSPTTWTILDTFDDPCGPPYPSYDPRTSYVGGLYRYICLDIMKNDGECGSHARVVEVQVFGNTPTPPVTPTPTIPRESFRLMAR